MEEKISVIVPVYMVEDYIRACVDSILGQSYGNLEVILVDDGSTDGCGRICDDYGKMDERVRVIHKTNGGLSDARNAGIGAATAEYLVFVDSDDFIEKNMIAQLYEALMNTDSDIAICNLRYVDAKGKPIASRDMIREYRIADDVWTREDFWKCYCRGGQIPCTVAWNKLYRRKLFEGLRYPKGKIREDQFILAELITRCEKICCVGETMYFYRQREGSIMSDKYAVRQLDIVDAFLENTGVFLKNHNRRMAEYSLIQAIVYLEAFSFEGNPVREKGNERIQQLRQVIMDMSGRLVQSEEKTRDTGIRQIQDSVWKKRICRKLRTDTGTRQIAVGGRKAATKTQEAETKKASGRNLPATDKEKNWMYMTIQFRLILWFYQRGMFPYRFARRCVRIWRSVKFLFKRNS